MNLPEERPVNNVFNLSSKSLTPAQLSTFSKGLKFIPTADPIDITKLIADIKEWNRRMRLREYFYDAENDDQLTTETKNSDFHWTPPIGRDKWFDSYIDAVKEDIIKGVKRKVSKKITRKMEKAIKQFLDDNDIVIRPADKGSGITVMDTKDKIFMELSDTSTYKQSFEDLTKKVTLYDT